MDTPAVVYMLHDLETDAMIGMGPFATRELAEQMAARLQSRFIPDWTKALYVEEHAIVTELPVRITDLPAEE